MRLIIGILILLIMTGCVSNSALMVGPRGKVVRCSSSGWGYIGIPMATMNFNDCKKDYSRMGYLPMEDAGFIGIILNEQQTSGQNVVARVIDGSPAAKADIRSNDIILEVNGHKPAGLDDLHNLMFGKKDTPVELSVMHEGETKNLALVRAPRPQLAR